MTSAIASARVLADGASRVRVTVLSIGTATPARAASIATGLGVPVQRVMEAVYRAPRILVDGLTPELGARMAELLRDLGCRVSVEPQESPEPPPPRLLDVSLHVVDSRRYGEIVEALAAFVGCDEEQAARLVAQSPAVVLGKVSAATVEELRTRLGEGASLTVSDPDAARYDLFLGACDAVVRDRISSDLRRRGRMPLASDGCLLSGLDRAEAEEIRATLGRVPALRIVNSDFLRFDIVLTGGSPSPPAEAALTEHAGIPERLVPRLFEALPITVMEAVRNRDMPVALQRLAATGLEVRADLVTFLRLGIELVSADPGVRVDDVLERLGLETEARVDVPGRLPFVMPELQARLVRDALAGAGIVAELFEPGGQ